MEEQKFYDEELERYDSEELFDEELNKALEEAEKRYEVVEVQYVNLMWIIPTSESWHDKQIKAIILDLPMLQNKNQAQTQVKTQTNKNQSISTSPAMVLADAERKGMFYVMYIHQVLKMQVGVGYAIQFRINKQGQIEDFKRYDLTKKGNILLSIQKLKNKFLEELRKAYSMRPDTWKVVAEYYGEDDIDKIPF